MGGENRFYFANVNIGNSITSTRNTQSQQAREYLVHKLINSIDLRTALTMAEAVVVNERPNGEYIDLSPEALDKTTIINLVK